MPSNATPATEHTGFNGGRLAATIIVVRDGDEGLEVWVQERVPTMRNYPGHVVFPGGGVDPRDFPPRTWDSGELWSGASTISMARLMGVTRYKAHALVFAAARELFEEAGALLVRDLGGDVLADARAYHTDRLALESHRISFTDFLEKERLKLDADLLAPWARWAGVDRGQWFDTFFFVATLPPGQALDATTFEAADANWFSPQLLLDGWRAGLVRLALPTWAQLVRLCDYARVRDVMNSASLSDLRLVIGEPVDDPRYHEYFTTIPIERI
ncbi:NUDIX domain-containing protein [Corynebacterium lizhenjunii]|uniref:NUDIX domain-containing protein n=1 Tax=Corynebacterium lizhenjunii TaxID=2709394 RepID=A0A7T0KH21_9CORY|nr:NUDIX domain-containing protein [Corynebacterium lizhenjunii]QPK80019.1 NUDIX domain-containing protein [Corynebacterium lizhenjunii]